MASERQWLDWMECEWRCIAERLQAGSLYSLGASVFRSVKVYVGRPWTENLRVVVVQRGNHAGGFRHRHNVNPQS